MKIRYILVDDNPNILSDVKRKIDSIANAYELEHIASYHSSKKASEEITSLSYDLLIVDYEMPVYNGVELAQKVANAKKIIFLTSTINNEQNVINNLDISGYLSKPFELEKFEAVLKNKIIGKIDFKPMNNKNFYISIPVGANKNIGIYPDKISYITTSMNYKGDQPKKNCVNIYGDNDHLIHKDVRYSINDLAVLLNKYKFEKINKSTIINMSCIKERDNRNLKLYDTKETFEITDKEKPSFISKLTSFFSPKN